MSPARSSFNRRSMTALAAFIWVLFATAAVFASEPDMLVPSAGAQWYQNIVPRGRVGGGYSHGQFLIAQQLTHPGVDIGGGCRLAVYAADAGEVVKIVKASDPDYGVPGKSGVGNAVVIKHADAGGGPVYTAYLHMAKAPLVAKGPIERGQKIGLTGATGFAKGCHLHFEVRHFAGIRGLYNEDWKNIYGKGDKRRDPVFLAGWSDPETWVASRPQLVSGTASTQSGGFGPLWEKFEAACSVPGTRSPNVPCPYIEPDTCMGEACRAFGALEIVGRLDLLISPNSEKYAFSLAPGDYAFFRSHSFSAPCLTTVLRGEPYGLAAGETVHRLGSVGEGFVRYLRGNAIVSSDLAEADAGLSYAPGCIIRLTDWLQIENQQGQVGWLPIDTKKMNGTSFFSEHKRAIPGWVSARIRQFKLQRTYTGRDITPVAGKWGPEIVVPEDKIQAIFSADCGSDLAACYRSLDIQQQAQQFSAAISPEYPGGGFAEKFTEYGRVDLVTAFHQAANTNERFWMVNGSPQVVFGWVDGQRLSQVARSTVARQLVRRYPQASIRGGGRFVGYRILPNGGQRFVFFDVITNQCRACDILGSVYVYHDFDATGRYLGKSAPVVLDKRFGPVWPSEGAANDVELKRRPYEIQRRLHQRGYDAGPIDGVIGQKTIRAIREFQAENCIPVTGEPGYWMLGLLLEGGSSCAPSAARLTKYDLGQ